MPIRPQHRWLYPIDWPQLSAMIRFTRAKGRCEQCGRPQGTLVYHRGAGGWWAAARPAGRRGRGRILASLGSASPAPGLPGLRTTRVFLATGHLDHDPGNNTPRNLRAFCQRCHMLHDRPEHRRRRRLTLRMRRAMGDLFSGPYRSV